MSLAVDDQFRGRVDTLRTGCGLGHDRHVIIMGKGTLMSLTVQATATGESRWMVWPEPGGPMRTVTSWEELDALARERGIAPRDIRFQPQALDQMTEALGPPPSSEG
jgi:hypothetical protein